MTHTQPPRSKFERRMIQNNFTKVEAIVNSRPLSVEKIKEIDSQLPSPPTFLLPAKCMEDSATPGISNRFKPKHEEILRLETLCFSTIMLFKEKNGDVFELQAFIQTKMGK